MAHDGGGEMFGFPRLRALIARHAEEQRVLGDFLPTPRVLFRATITAGGAVQVSAALERRVRIARECGGSGVP